MNQKELAETFMLNLNLVFMVYKKINGLRLKIASSHGTAISITRDCLSCYVTYYDWY